MEHPICSLCGNNTYTVVKRTNTKGETALDVCLLCNYDAVKTVSRQNTRARQKGIPSRLSSAEWIEILQQSKGYCIYCQEYEGCPRLTPDHVVALGKGGTNSAENIAAACLLCNVFKQARSAEEWLKEIQNGYYKRPGVTYTRDGRRVRV